MPNVTVSGQQYTCEPGVNLRQFMLEKGLPVYNGRAAVLNCQGHSTCGTCAVGIQGEVSEPTRSEKIRLGLPPHQGIKGGRRLACQVKVLGDIEVTKYGGFFVKEQRLYQWLKCRHTPSFTLLNTLFTHSIV